MGIGFVEVTFGHFPGAPNQSEKYHWKEHQNATT